MVWYRVTVSDMAAKNIVKLQRELFKILPLGKANQNKLLIPHRSSELSFRAASVIV